MIKKTYIFFISLFFTLFLEYFFIDLSNIFGLKKIIIRAVSLVIIGTPLLLFHLKYNKKQLLEIFKIKKPWLKTSTTISLIIILIAFFIRIITKSEEQQLFTFAKSNHYGQYGIYIYLLFYSVHCFLQQLIIQGLGFEGFLSINLRISKNILIVIFATIFGISHFYLGTQTVILTFLVEIILSKIYLHYRHIWSVSLIHYFVGLISISFGWS